MHRVQQTARSTAQAVMATGLVLVQATLLLVAAPELERRWWPVLAEASFTVVDEGVPAPDRIVFDWTVDKRRACKLTDIAALVSVNAGQWWRADVVRADSGAGLQPLHRPTGRQHLRRLAVMPRGEAFRLELRYRCHPLWDSVVTLPAVYVNGDKNGGDR